MKKKVKIILYVVVFLVFLGSIFIIQPASYNSAGINVGPRGGGVDPTNGIYVSVNGNDSTATGSKDKPFKSINRALEKASSGSTIILRGGTYQEGINVRIRKPNITIKSAQGEWAVIDLTSYDSGHKEDSAVYFDVDSSGSKLQSVEVIGGWYAVALETRWDWGEANRAGASNITIEDCILHDSRYDVVKIKPNCDNVTIRYNEIYNSGQAFIGKPKNGEDNAEGIDNVNGDAMVVQNNYIHDICSNAIYAKGGATNTLIENNRIEKAYGAGIMVGFDTSPEFFDTKVNPQYYENINGIVRNNLIINTGWEGIGFYGAKDAQVYNNTLVNVSNGLYHSAIYFGLTYQDWESYAKRPASINPSIHHNIVSQPASITHPMVEIRYANDLGGMSALSGNPLMNNNCYYIASKSATFTDNRPSSKLSNANLTTWKSHISGEEGSLEANPSLDNNYMPTNSECTAMGITSNPIVNKNTSKTSVAPKISGPTSMTLQLGYKKTSTKAYTITGTTPISVTKTSGSEKITWNNTTKKLDIDEGLAVGVYTVKLKASNGVTPDATLSFKLTVQEEIVEEMFNIIILESANGVATANTQTAYPGEEIILEFSANEGYVFESWLINADLEIIDNKFIMPESDVTIEPLFTKIEEGINNTRQKKEKKKVSWWLLIVIPVIGSLAFGVIYLKRRKITTA